MHGSETPAFVIFSISAEHDPHPTTPFHAVSNAPTNAQAGAANGDVSATRQSPVRRPRQMEH